MLNHIKNIYFDLDTLHKPMASLTRLLRRSLSTAAATTVLSAGSARSQIYREKDLARLVEKFKQASNDYRFRTHIGIYKNSVRRLANAERFEWVEEILEHQKQFKDFSKEGFTSRIIYLYGISGMFDHAKKVFDEMPQRNCTRTVLSFNALLGACVNSKKYDLFDGLFKDLAKELGVKPDVVSFNTLVKAYCEMGKIENASLVIEEMEEKGLKPDVISYNTILLSLYGNGKFVEGEKMWERMLSKDIVPDIRTYNARLKGLAKEKKMDEAVDLVAEMRGKDVLPDEFSFEPLIKGFVDVEELEKAKQWYNEMVSSGCIVNKHIFIKLVPFVIERGELEFGLKVCRDAISNRVLVGREVLQKVVDALAKEKKMEEARELVEMCKLNNYCSYKLKLQE